MEKDYFKSWQVYKDAEGKQGELLNLIKYLKIFDSVMITKI